MTVALVKKDAGKIQTDSDAFSAPSGLVAGYVLADPNARRATLAGYALRTHRHGNFPRQADVQAAMPAWLQLLYVFLISEIRLRSGKNMGSCNCTYLRFAEVNGQCSFARAPFALPDLACTAPIYLPSAFFFWEPSPTQTGTVAAAFHSIFHVSRRFQVRICVSFSVLFLLFLLWDSDFIDIPAPSTLRQVCINPASFIDTRTPTPHRMRLPAAIVQAHDPCIFLLPSPLTPDLADPCGAVQLDRERGILVRRDLGCMGPEQT
ncbi:hypothetical protein C8R44DRAFT_735334 [Mycena epipterygia]|nr:hypothetical protein C8R44DRAFT_735334 [Mycena epipterygia]